jgi:hypothetical protein
MKTCRPGSKRRPRPCSRLRPASSPRPASTCLPDSGGRPLWSRIQGRSRRAGRRQRRPRTSRATSLDQAHPSQRNNQRPDSRRCRCFLQPSEDGRRQGLMLHAARPAHPAPGALPGRTNRAELVRQLTAAKGFEGRHGDVFDALAGRFDGPGATTRPTWPSSACRCWPPARTPAPRSDCCWRTSAATGWPARTAATRA